MTAKFVAAVALAGIVGWGGSALAGGSKDAGQAKSATCVACHGVDGNSANPEWISGTWNPRLVKIPVPIMFAITIPMAVKSPTRRLDWAGIAFVGLKRPTLNAQRTTHNEELRRWALDVER